jgi:23S rRNA (uracil1939-C5)-methyltransferase
VPGDVVEGRLVDERKRFARAELLVVVEPSPGRVTPPCPHVARGCGGCGWQHVELGAQREAKRRLVADALTRLGRLDARTSMPGRRGNHVEVTSGPALATQAFRTTVRCGVLDGRPALRRSRSHELVDVDGCPVAHPLLVELLAEARFPGAAEVTLRCGARTGERLVLVQPSLAGGAAGVVVPSDVIVAGPDRPAAYHEEAAGRRWRISGTSFFQSRADGADLLVARVRELLGPEP